MKIEPEIFQYLSGKRFASNLVFNLEKDKLKPVSREAAIISLVRDKSVIHIGCSDHKELIEEKIKQNLWLHKLITETTSTCIGIDIDEESINFIKKELQFNNVYSGNILTDDFPVIRDRKWDFVLFGEIIEHLDNPVDFLETFRHKYGQSVARFIISVPNVYNKHQFKNMLDFREIINSDHRFWFTPYTILKVLVQSGYRPENIIFGNRQPLTNSELIVRKIKKLTGRESYYPYYYFKTLIISGILT